MQVGERGRFLLDLGRTILRLEKARRVLVAVDPGDKEKLLAASRKVDKLILEYYQAKTRPKGVGGRGGE
ncbi:aspartyl-phosphate phosphatase Spo0E family protein [Desulfofundulus kuznetsovii]|uniref:aspartyl-phosphate phosphatase Spo0E family protein n=1 Tax=Desulfofundulus kuznetsovii TaxID=58135 RepID=UPI00338EC923